VVKAAAMNRRQRVSLSLLGSSRARLHKPELLILNGPFAGLHTEGSELLDRELAGMREHRTILVATHDPERLAALASGRLALV